MIHWSSDVVSARVAHCDAQHSTAKLPVELVVHIMRSGLDFSSQRSLSQISRSFRNISFLVPEFWATIVPKFPLDEDQLDYWKWSIVNSKTVPLDIKLNIPEQCPLSEVDQNQGFLLLFPELASNATRWRSFELITELPGPMNLLLTEIIPMMIFPQLENLRLACVEPIAPRAWFTNSRPEDPRQVMPRLRSLTLWNVQTRYPGTRILNGLVDLRLIGDLHGTMPPLEEIINTLKSTPHLEVLCLTVAPPPTNHLSPPPATNDALHVVLPRLRSLTFRGLSKMAGICILPLLHLPALEEFHLENTSAWLDRSVSVPDRARIPEDYSSVIQTITFLNMPWGGSGNVFTAPTGPQWPQGKLKELTLGWVTAEAMPLLDWLSFMHGLTTLRTKFSDVDLLRVLQDGNVCPQLQALYVEGFMDQANCNELEGVMRARPNLEVNVEATLAGDGHVLHSWW